MNIKIIIKDAEADIIKATHESEAFIEHLAEKLAVAFGLEKEAVAATVTQAINSAPTVGESSGSTESPSTIPSGVQENTTQGTIVDTLLSVQAEGDTATGSTGTATDSGQATS